MKLNPRFKGRAHYRLKPSAGNPHELIAIKHWIKQHPGDGHRGTLPYLLGDGMTPEEPSDRDWEVAATVIQWLGSPIGRSFLRDLMDDFEKHNKKGRRRR